MASDRATYTAEDVLDLLNDVESNMREGDCHFAASVSTHEVQHDIALVAPMGDTRRPRIRLPYRSSRAPIPPITGSREEWPPRHSNVFQATPTDDPKRPRVRLPRLPLRLRALSVTNSRERLSSPTSNLERTHNRLSQCLESHPLLSPEDQSSLDSPMGQVESAGIEADDSDPPGLLSQLATCEQGEPIHAGHIFHAEDMELDSVPRSTLTGGETAVTPNGTRNKRPRAADLWDNDVEEQQRHASKRVKLVSVMSTPATPTQQEIAYNSFSEPPHQPSLLDWNSLKVGTTSPVPNSCHAKMESERLDLHDIGLSSGNSSMLHTDNMDVDPPETPSNSRQISSTLNEVARRRRSAEARKWKDRATNRILPSYGSPQNAGYLKSHKSPLRSMPRRDIVRDSGLPARPVGLSDLPDDLLDRIFTILLKSEDDEITLSTSWLMTFVNGVAGAPSVMQLNSRQPSTLKSAPVLRSDLKRINASLKAIPDDKWPRDTAKSQTGVLTRSLLTVSKAFHERASRIFYGSNTFNFTHPKTCWMHLEAFLATIGSKNASHIRHICLRAPIWHTGVRRDAIIGALFDGMAPVTRLAAFKVPADDRLLSAIKTCANALGESGNLESLQVDVVYKDNALHFINRSQDSRYPIHADELAHHDQRRDVGCQTLSRWSSESFAPNNKPKLVAHSMNPVTPLEVSRFRKILAPMIREAEKYGWTVDQHLKEPGKPGRNVYRRHCV